MHTQPAPTGQAPVVYTARCLHDPPGSISWLDLRGGGALDAGRCGARMGISVGKHWCEYCKVWMGSQAELLHMPRRRAVWKEYPDDVAGVVAREWPGTALIGPGPR